jgi:hypothetical protein
MNILRLDKYTAQTDNVDTFVNFNNNHFSRHKTVNSRFIPVKLSGNELDVKKDGVVLNRGGIGISVGSRTVNTGRIKPLPKRTRTSYLPIRKEFILSDPVVEREGELELETEKLAKEAFFSNVGQAVAIGNLAAQIFGNKFTPESIIKNISNINAPEHANIGRDNLIAAVFKGMENMLNVDLSNEQTVQRISTAVNVVKEILPEVLPSLDLNIPIGKKLLTWISKAPRSIAKMVAKGQTKMFNALQMVLEQSNGSITIKGEEIKLDGGDTIKIERILDADEALLQGLANGLSTPADVRDFSIALINVLNPQQRPLVDFSGDELKVGDSFVPSISSLPNIKIPSSPDPSLSSFGTADNSIASTPATFKTPALGVDSPVAKAVKGISISKQPVKPTQPKSQLKQSDSTAVLQARNLLAGLRNKLLKSIKVVEQGSFEKTHPDKKWSLDKKRDLVNTTNEFINSLKPLDPDGQPRKGVVILNEDDVNALADRLTKLNSRLVKKLNSLTSVSSQSSLPPAFQNPKAVTPPQADLEAKAKKDKRNAELKDKLKGAFKKVGSAFIDKFDSESPTRSIVPRVRSPTRRDVLAAKMKALK